MSITEYRKILEERINKLEMTKQGVEDYGNHGSRYHETDYLRAQRQIKTYEIVLQELGQITNLE